MAPWPGRFELWAGLSRSRASASPVATDPLVWAGADHLLRALSAQWHRNLAMVFQSFALLPWRPAMCSQRDRQHRP